MGGRWVSDPAVRKHLLVSVLSHTLNGNVSLRPASSLGHGGDQKAVEFLTEVQGGTQMA